jgi:hypothetical protein
VSWPPRIGEPLPRAEDAYGIHEKLATYSFDLKHRVGGPKAAGFQRILGITVRDLSTRASQLATPCRRSAVACTVYREGSRQLAICFLRGRRDHKESPAGPDGARHDH